MSYINVSFILADLHAHILNKIKHSLYVWQQLIAFLSFSSLAFISIQLSNEQICSSLLFSAEKAFHSLPHSYKWRMPNILIYIILFITWARLSSSQSGKQASIRIWYAGGKFSVLHILLLSLHAIIWSETVLIECVVSARTLRFFIIILFYCWKNVNNMFSIVFILWISDLCVFFCEPPTMLVCAYIKSPSMNVQKCLCY